MTHPAEKDALTAIATLADELAAFDCCTDEVPDSVDVPDDYELGMNHAGARLHALLARVTPPAEKGQADA